MKRAALACTAFAALAAFLPALASADPLVVRSSRADYGESEVDRPEVLAKEWVEFTLDYAYRDVVQYTDASGFTHDANYTYRYSWMTLGMRYGFTRNLTLFLDIPYSMGTALSGGTDQNPPMIAWGLGDARFGFAWQCYHRDAPGQMTSVALQLDTKQPSGNQSVGVIGARQIPLGTGTTNLGLTLLAKQRLGRLAAEADLAYIHKFSAVTEWVRDEDGPLGLNGRVKPGDEVDAGLHLLAQPWRMYGLKGGLDYIYRGDAAIGHTSNGLNPDSALNTLPGSGFQALNASARVLVEPSVNWTFTGGVTYPVISYNSGYFLPLEDLSQSYGLTLFGSASYRW